MQRMQFPAYSVIGKVGSTRLTKFTANIVWKAELLGNKAQSQRAHNQQQSRTQSKMIEVQRLLPEYTPAKNCQHYGDDDTKDTKRAIDHPIGQHSTHLAAYILEGNNLAREFGVITQRREIRRPVNKVRQYRCGRYKTHNRHYETRHPRHVVVRWRSNARSALF